MGQTLFQNTCWFLKETLISLKKRQSLFSLVYGRISFLLIGPSNGLGNRPSKHSSKHHDVMQSAGVLRDWEDTAIPHMRWDATIYPETV